MTKPEVCLWTTGTENYQGEEYWETDCGNAFEFIEAGPKGNGFSFCPYCGRRLVARNFDDIMGWE